MKKTLLPVIFLLSILQSVSALAQAEIPAPNKCECQFARKDYDPEKGYYFDKVSYFPIPTVSGRFGCLYYCQDLRGQMIYVTHVFEDWYVGTVKGTAENAKKMICPQSIAKFIPKYDLVGHVQYYEIVPVGNFSAATSSIPEIKKWASEQTCQ